MRQPGYYGVIGCMKDRNFSYCRSPHRHQPDRTSHSCTSQGWVYRYVGTRRSAPANLRFDRLGGSKHVYAPSTSWGLLTASKSCYAAAAPGVRSCSISRPLTSAVFCSAVSEAEGRSIAAAVAAPLSSASACLSESARIAASASASASSSASGSSSNASAGIRPCLIHQLHTSPLAYARALLCRHEDGNGSSTLGGNPHMKPSYRV